MPQFLTIRVTIAGMILRFCHCWWHNPASSALRRPLGPLLGRQQPGDAVYIGSPRESTGRPRGQVTCFSRPDDALAGQKS
jgi:hypothetical protein